MLVLGIDSSTTATKAIAWDPHGTAVAEGRSAFELSNPDVNAWEQDAESWWSAARLAIAECVRGLGPRAREIAALSIAHQRETFVLTDDDGKPLCPAIVWMDSRGGDQVTRAVERFGASRLHELSGKPPCITPSVYKLMALFGRRPDLAKARPRVLDVHAFLAWRLTGRCATSLASADPLGLVDMQARSWSDELLALADLAKAQLPELVEPGAELGHLDAQIAATIGLRAGLPVIAGAGDGQAAGLGAGISGPGRAYLNLGTAIVSGLLSNDYRINNAFRTLYAASPGTFFLETDLKGGTFILNWLAERLLGARDTGEALGKLEAEATGLRAGSDGLMLVPYWNGVMNPYWDDDATGIMVGLTGRHGAAHVYRGVLEGIAFEQRLHTRAVETALESPVEELIVMGGGSRSELWCQIISDVLETRVLRARTAEATALGAGILAAVGAGLHADLETATRHMTGTAERFSPGPNSARYGELYREVYEKLYPSLRGPLERLSELTRGA